MLLIDALRDRFVRTRSVWLTLALVAFFEVTHHLQGVPHVSSPYLGPPFGLLLVYVAFTQGLRLGLLSLGLALAYQFWELSLPGRLFTYSPQDSEVLLTVAATYLGTVGLASGLRHKLERAVRLEAEHETALAVASELRATNAELQRLAAELRSRNEEIEALVAQRTHELAAEKALLDRILHHVPAGVLYLDRNLRIRVGKPFGSSFETSGETLVGKSIYDLVPYPNPRLEAALETLEPQHATGIRFPVIRDGQEVVKHVDSLFLPIVSEASGLEGILVFALDVSDRVEIERLQEEQIKNLQEVDRLKGDFINVASHELRTPLSSIQGYAEFLEDGVAGSLTPDQREFVSQIQEGARRLRRIVDDMLDFARLEAGTFSLAPQEACLRQLIQDEISSLAPQLREARLALALELTAEPSWARMDPRRIGQVLLNLLSNAIKFTPPGGSLTVRTRTAEGMIRVEVEDSGIGVSSESQARLFEKFYQVDPSITRSYGGAGLGLAISKAIVEGHGGSIGLESAPGHGSTFWFTLPLLPDPAPLVTLSTLAE